MPRGELVNAILFVAFGFAAGDIIVRSAELVSLVNPHFWVLPK